MHRFQYNSTVAITTNKIKINMNQVDPGGVPTSRRVRGTQWKTKPSAQLKRPEGTMGERLIEDAQISI